MTDFLSTSEVATQTGKSKSAVKNAILRGHLIAKKVGRYYAVRPQDVKKWLNDPSAHKPGKKPKNRRVARKIKRGMKTDE